ncbi:MAG: hypothetical protein IPJ39_19785 [Saprospiraceae bacterium]|nr:hypothetical protein [Saprospiraceae bacterium]
MSLIKNRYCFTYINNTPLHTDNYVDYTWSSYGAYLTDIKRAFCRNEGIDWFGNKNNFYAIWSSISEKQII